MPRNALIHGHNYVPPSLKFHKTRKDGIAEPFMGFELEAGGATEAEKDDAAYAIMHEIKSQNVNLLHDGTIPYAGFEMVSQPFTLNAHYDAPWAKMLKICIGHGFKSHDLGSVVGIHVHITRDRTTEQMWRLADAFINRFQDDFEKIARRHGTSYCKYNSDTCWIDVRGNARRTCKPGYSNDRYRALNFQNADTIEFRIFNGSLIHNTLLATLELVHSIWNALHMHEDDYATLVPNETCLIDDYVAAVELFKKDWLKLLSDDTRYSRALAYVKSKCAFENELKLEPQFELPEPVEELFNAAS